MESPFFRNHWNYPHSQGSRYAPSLAGVPVQRRKMPVAPKVVSIPVRFVGSEKSRSESITKIQKVIRGFLVRKSVKKVKAIKREVDEVERMLASDETIGMIRNDAKERLKFGEMLMSLLLKLDSVKGVDLGVRNFRKAVIKKAIALQEKIDLIAVSDEGIEVVDEAQKLGNSECGSEAIDVCLETNDSVAIENGDEETLEHGRIPDHKSEASTADVANNCYPLEAQPETCDGERIAIESLDDCRELENNENVVSERCSIENHGVSVMESTLSSSELKVDPQVAGLDNDPLRLQVSEDEGDLPCEITEKDEFLEAETAAEPKLLNDLVHPAIEWAEDPAETSEAESQTDSSANPPNLAEGVVENAAVEEIEGGGNEKDRVGEEDGRMKEPEDEKQSRELLEKMIMDNKKMMEMMTQLFERNEMQTRLLGALSQRVEQLEKAFVCETLRRKKKRNGSVDGSEKNPKTKKCGK